MSILIAPPPPAVASPEANCSQVLTSAMSERDLSGQLARLINGYQVSQAIHVAATLGIPDLLGEGPRSSGALATATQTHPTALYRLLRALASVGILHEHDNRQFVLAPWAISFDRTYLLRRMHGLSLLAGRTIGTPGVICLVA